MAMGLFRRMVWGLTCAVLTAPAMAASNLSEAVTAAADRLVATQQAGGSWAGSEAYTGPAVAGLINAYDQTGTASYLAAATLAGTYIISSAEEIGFYGDEAWGLTRLSEKAADPSNNVWRTAVARFYDRVATAPGGTNGYIAELKAGYPGEDSQPLFYLAHHALAASYVGAADKALWRQAVIDTLALVEDTDVYPVMSLGVAIWALSQTGSGLDATTIPVTGDPVPGTYEGKKLSELPPILASHQVPTGGTYPSSFYCWFDHTQSPAAGYTEDTIYGTLGLIAATAAGYPYEARVEAARRALVNGNRYANPAPPDYGVQTTGLVGEHIWTSSFYSSAFVGEVLIVLAIQPQILTATSWRLHGSEGNYGVNLKAPLGGLDVAVECRKDGPTALVFGFDVPIAGSGPGGTAVPADVQIDDTAGSIITVSSVFLSGKSLRVNLTGVANASRAKIIFPGITDLSGNACADSVCMGVLYGDVTSDGIVDLSDMLSIRDRLNQTSTSANFRNDVFTDGILNLSDMLGVRDNLNKTVPPGGC